MYYVAQCILKMGGKSISKMGIAWRASRLENSGRLKKSKVITSVINLVPMKVMDWKQTDLFLLILLCLWQEFRRVMNLLFYGTSFLGVRILPSVFYIKEPFHS